MSVRDAITVNLRGIGVYKMTLLIKGIATASLALVVGYLGSDFTSSLAADGDLKQAVNNPSAIAQSIPLQNTVVVPGKRVGPITRNTTRQNLVKLFGELRLKDSTISGPEGIGTFAITRVNLGTQRSFTVVWSDATRTKLLDVRDLGSAWKTPEGIGVGTSLATLRQKLGAFKIFGLGWDYGGTVVLAGTRLSAYQGKLLLRVDAAPNAATQFPNDYQAVSGDRELAASNAHWRRLGIKVQEMIVVLNTS